MTLAIPQVAGKNRGVRHLLIAAALIAVPAAARQGPAADVSQARLHADVETLVGFGTRMGSGCTSGHGIIGLARFSRRSIAATAMFLGGGLLTASLLELVR